MRGWRFKLFLVVVIIVVMITSMTTTASAVEPVVGISDVWAQMTADTTLQSEKTDLRFIMAVDSLEYKEVGFIISQHPLTGIEFDKLEFTPSSSNPDVEVALINGRSYLKIRITTVYESIRADNEVVTAEDLGGAYLASCSVANIANKNFADTCRVIGYSVKKDKTTLETTTAYTKEKISSIAAQLNGLQIAPDGSGGIIDFGDLNIGSTATSYGDYVLMSTWNDNLRSGSNRTTTARGNISLIELGNDIVIGNIKEFKYVGAGNVDALVGGPVKVGFDASGNAVTVEPLGTSVSYRESDFKVSGTTVSLKSGSSLNISTANLIDNYSRYSYVPSGLMNIGTKSFADVANTDEYITLYDTNIDGTYDFYSRKPIVNAVEVVGITENTIQLFGQYGSADSTGWFGENAKYFNYDKAYGVGDIKVGDRINILLTIDCDSNTYAHATFPARITVLSKSDSFTGNLNSVTYGDYKDANVSGGYSVISDYASEDVYKYIDITVGSKNY